MRMYVPRHFVCVTTINTINYSSSSYNAAVVYCTGRYQAAETGREKRFFSYDMYHVQFLLCSWLLYSWYQVYDACCWRRLLIGFIVRQTQAPDGMGTRVHALV